MTFSDFILLLKEGPNACVIALYPVKNFLATQVQRHENDKKERKKQEEMDRIACKEI